MWQREAGCETADLFMAVIMYRLMKNGRSAVILPDGFLFGLDNAILFFKKCRSLSKQPHTILYTTKPASAVHPINTRSADWSKIHIAVFAYIC